MTKRAARFDRGERAIPGPPARLSLPRLTPLQFGALAIVVAWLLVSVPLFWAEDATGYLAAGERLNAGHALYSLGPGDRVVDVRPPYFSSPFLYPPIWGVVWRPLAALPIGLPVWMAFVSVVMLAWLLRTLSLGGKGTAAIIALLGAPFAVMLASGNVSGLILVGIAAVPTLRDRPAGLLVGAMAAVKLIPAILILWLLATHRYRAAAWAVGTGLALTLAGVVLGGPDLTLEYLRVVIPETHPLGISPALLTGLPWLTYVLLAVGIALVLIRRSFTAAVFTVVFGTPVVGVASLSVLGAALQPTGPRRPSERVAPVDAPGGSVPPPE